jgi:hypothetical protein
MFDEWDLVCVQASAIQEECPLEIRDQWGGQVVSSEAKLSDLGHYIYLMMALASAEHFII